MLEIPYQKSRRLVYRVEGCNENANGTWRNEYCRNPRALSFPNVTEFEGQMKNSGDMRQKNQRFIEGDAIDNWEAPAATEAKALTLPISQASCPLSAYTTQEIFLNNL